jgi:hypothetical protein
MFAVVAAELLRLLDDESLANSLGLSSLGGTKSGSLGCRSYKIKYPFERSPGIEVSTVSRDCLSV